MKRMPYKRPTTHYDERVKEIDEKICELIYKRKEVSNNNPGYPPFEYISDWAQKFNLYEEFLKLMFGSIWSEAFFKPQVEPQGYIKVLPVLKVIEVEDRIFSVTFIRQYSNCSVLNLNIDLNGDKSDSIENRVRNNNFELFISESYDCQMESGSGSGKHSYYEFIISPALPDDFSGIELIFREYTFPNKNEQVSPDIILKI